MKPGYFSSFLCVSLSVSLASFTSAFHTHTHTLSLSLAIFLYLSLSLSCFLFVFFFFFRPCCFGYFVKTFLAFWFFFLALFLCFCFMITTTSKYYVWEASFHQLLLFLLGFRFCFVFQIPLSYLCFSLFKLCVLVNMNVFIFLRRPFLKHRFLLCT